MGYTLAGHLVKSGWNVACVDVNVENGKRAASELGPNADFFQANVASYASQASMFQAVWDKWHRLDALCANAGVVDRSSVYILNHRNSVEYVLHCS